MDWTQLANGQKIAIFKNRLVDMLTIFSSELPKSCKQVVHACLNWSNTHSGWLGMDDCALHQLIYWIIGMYWSYFKKKLKKVTQAQTYIFHACMRTNTHLWASLQEGAEASQSERRQGNIISDHLIGLAPDRQPLPRQTVRGPELTLRSRFGYR